MNSELIYDDLSESDRQGDLFFDKSLQELKNFVFVCFIYYVFLLFFLNKFYLLFPQKISELLSLFLGDSSSSAV